MTSLEDYGQHTWHYVFKNKAKTEIIFKSHQIFCFDVVEEMANYLAATGFLRSNIIDAFEAYADEYKKALICGAKSLENSVVEESK